MRQVLFAGTGVLLGRARIQQQQNELESLKLLCFVPLSVHHLHGLPCKPHAGTCKQTLMFTHTGTLHTPISPSHKINSQSNVISGWDGAFKAVLITTSVLQITPKLSPKNKHSLSHSLRVRELTVPCCGCFWLRMSHKFSVKVSSEVSWSQSSPEGRICFYS